MLIPVVTTADAGFVMPLAAMMISSRRNLGAGNALDFYVLDGGIPADAKRLLDTVNGSPVHWIEVDPKPFEGLPVRWHLALPAYYRLCMGTILPPTLDRVLYLDSDLVVEGDLMELWNLAQPQSLLAAAVDSARPLMDCSRVLPQARYLSRRPGVRNYQALGIPETAPCLNSGVMVVNLRVWREERIENRLMAYVREHSELLELADQDAINAVLWNRWEELPAQWNVQYGNLIRFPRSATGVHSPETFAEMSQRPKVIHYVGPSKPWKLFLADRPRSWQFRRYFEYLDQTPWRGYRPWKDPAEISRAWKAFVRGGTPRLGFRIAWVKGVWRTLKGDLSRS